MTATKEAARRRARIVKLSKEGKTLREIGEAFGLTISAVYGALLADGLAGLTVRVRRERGLSTARKTPESIEMDCRILAVRKRGAKLQEIADEFGVSRQAIWNRIKCATAQAEKRAAYRNRARQLTTGDRENANAA